MVFSGHYLDDLHFNLMQYTANECYVRAFTWSGSIWDLKIAPFSTILGPWVSKEHQELVLTAEK
jgi:hypothetical protein